LDRPKEGCLRSTGSRKKLNLNNEGDKIGEKETDPRKDWKGILNNKYDLGSYPLHNTPLPADFFHALGP